MISFTSVFYNLICFRNLVMNYICYMFFPYHRSFNMESFGFHYSDVVLNIEHIVVDGISNGNAHGPSRNEFTSPFCFISIFTIRILFAILSEVRTTFSFQISKRKRMMKKTFINISYPNKVRCPFQPLLIFVCTFRRSVCRDERRRFI